MRSGSSRNGQLAAGLGALVGAASRSSGSRRRESARQSASTAVAQLAGQLRVAGDVPGVEQAERGLQVVAGDLRGLVDGAHRVVEAQAGVPDRVPDAVGERGRRRRPAVVQQDQVEVAARGELAAAVAADRDQRDPGAGADAASACAQPSARSARVGVRAAQVRAPAPSSQRSTSAARVLAGRARTSEPRPPVDPL